MIRVNNPYTLVVRFGRDVEWNKEVWLFVSWGYSRFIRIYHDRIPYQTIRNSDYCKWAVQLLLWLFADCAIRPKITHHYPVMITHHYFICTIVFLWRENNACIFFGNWTRDRRPNMSDYIDCITWVAGLIGMNIETGLFFLNDITRIR